MTDRVLDDSVYCSASREPRLVWLETLKPMQNITTPDLKCTKGIIPLHPDVFATFPRIDLIHKNLYWQAHYRMVVSDLNLTNFYFIYRFLLYMYFYLWTIFN